MPDNLIHDYYPSRNKSNTISIILLILQTTQILYDVSFKVYGIILESEYIVYILVPFLVYFFVVSCLGWLKSSSEVRNTWAYKLDFSILLILFVSSILTLFDFWTVGSSPTLWSIGWLFLICPVTIAAGMAISMVVLGIHLTRTKARSKRTQLSRVPVASASIILFSIFIFFIISFIIYYIFNNRPQSVDFGSIYIVVLLFIFTIVYNEWSLLVKYDESGSRIPIPERIQQLQKSVDAHDSYYEVASLKNIIDNAEVYSEQDEKVTGEDKKRALVGLMKKNFSDINPDIISAAQRGDIEAIERCLNEGASPNESGAKDWTPLMTAAAEGHEDACRFLLNNGARPNQSNVFGRGPLHYSSRYGYDTVSRLLIEHGADVNMASVENSTPIFIASYHGHTSTVELLLENGATTDIENVKSYTPVEVAENNRNGEVAKIIRTS